MQESALPLPQATSRPAGRPSAWWTLAIVTVATFMLMLDLTVVNVALPEIRTALRSGFSGLQWVLDAYALTLAAFLLTAGFLADRLGRRRVFTAGFLVFSAASLACGLAGGILALNVARAVQGIGAAVLFAVGPALIGQEFHGKARGTAFSVFGAGAGLAIAAGPLIGGALTSGLSWRWIFLVNVPIGVGACALGRWRMRESVRPRAHPLDWPGLVTFTLGLALLVSALLRGGADGWTSVATLATGTAGLALIGVFAALERAKRAAAMLDTALFRNTTFSGLPVVAVFLSAGAMAAIFLLVSYTENILGFSPWQAGLRFLPMTGVLFVTAALAGALTTRFPPGLLIVLACIAAAAGLAWARPLLLGSSSWTALLPCTILLGAGLGIFNPVRAYLAVGVTEPARAGAASGMSETFQQGGMALGIAAFGSLFQSRVSDSFASTQPGRRLGAAAGSLGRQIAAGGTRQLITAPPSRIPGLAAAARQSFAAGLAYTLPACAAAAALAAVAALAVIRRKDLHPSALAAVPGVPPEIPEELKYA
jgi:EmrB/QacA subfamily drug resistance transporter